MGSSIKMSNRVEKGRMMMYSMSRGEYDECMIARTGTTGENTLSVQRLEAGCVGNGEHCLAKDGPRLSSLRDNRRIKASDK